MSLGDIVGRMGLHIFAELAFLLAAAGFLTVLATMLLRRNREAFDRARFMPLDDDRPAPRTGEGTGDE